MRSIHDALRDSQRHLPEALAQELAGLYAREDLLGLLSTRLLIYTRQGVPGERPAPHFVGECTPPVADAFAPFRDAVVTWHHAPDAPTIAVQLAEAITRAGIAHLLVLLGQRRTPGSIVTARAVPPPREQLLRTACRAHGPGDALTVAARALTKHAPRGNASFWGEPAGSSEEKNAHAGRLIEHLLDQATWWNIFGHFQHGPVYEVRVPSGQGARWTHQGVAFIGFVEPFDPERRLESG